jgi:hypothetical protein
MRKHGLKSASKRARALAAAEEEADETLEFLDSRTSLGERHVRGGDLAVHLKQRADKEARLAKVLEGAPWLFVAVTVGSKCDEAHVIACTAILRHPACQCFLRRGFCLKRLS